MLRPADRSTRYRPGYAAMAGLLVLAVLLLGGLLHLWMTDTGRAEVARSLPDTGANADLDTLFTSAVSEMQQRRYVSALQLWHRALQLDADIPELQVNMGFTLYELDKPELARDFFRQAVELDPYQANAYYGLALCQEHAGDLPAAIGAMRSYIHLVRDRGQRDFVRRARAALWEWEARLAETD